MKGGSMLERTNKRLILNGNCRTIIENNEYMITQVSDPTGDGLMTMYHVFPGVSVLYSDFHMPFCESGFQTEYDMLCIDHCKEGRMEQEMGNGAYTYLEAGDLKIDRRIHHKGHIEFPTQHFHGVTIAFDMKEATKNLPLEMRDFPVDLYALQKKYCDSKHPFVIPGEPAIEHIFSELYSIPLNIKKYYLKVKILNSCFIWTH